MPTLAYARYRPGTCSPSCALPEVTSRQLLPSLASWRAIGVRNDTLDGNMKLARTAAVGLGSLSMAIGATFVAGTPANATVPNTYCNGRSYQTVVRTYTRSLSGLPLRCGNSSFGLVHFKDRWNSAFDSEMALTISRGEGVVDEQGDGGSSIYALFDSNCNELFRVIYGANAYNGNGVQPVGVISAYYRTASAVVAQDALAQVSAGSYRTDCPVYQSI